MSAEIALIWLAASADVATQRTLRLARAVEDRGGGVRADGGQCALDVARERLDVLGGVAWTPSTRVGWASRAPAVMESAVRCAGDRQARRDVGRERLDVLGGFRGGGDEGVLGLAGAGRDGLGGGRPGDRQRSAMSAASDLTCFAASEDELTSVFWTSRAPAVRASAVDLPAADRLTRRRMSAA